MKGLRYGAGVVTSIGPSEFFSSSYLLFKSYKLAAYPLMSFCNISLAVVGEKEKVNNAVNVRTRDNKVHGEILVMSAIEKLKKLKKSHALYAEEEF